MQNSMLGALNAWTRHEERVLQAPNEA